MMGPERVAPRPLARPRRGFSLLEVQVALIILGLALAGLCPLVLVQQKLMVSLEGRIQAYASYHSGANGSWVLDATSPQVVYYVVPFTEPMDLAFAQGTEQSSGDAFVAFGPTTTVAPVSGSINSVSLTSLDYQTSLQGVSAQVQVQVLP